MACPRLGDDLHCGDDLPSSSGNLRGTNAHMRHARPHARACMSQDEGIYTWMYNQKQANLVVTTCCYGDSYMGNRTLGKYHFRGEEAVRTMFVDLKRNHGLGSSSRCSD